MKFCALITLPVASIALAVAALPPAAKAALRDTVDFIREVRPIFADHCVKCHGPDKQKGGLRLDLKASLMKGGDDGKVIEPGHSADSKLVHLVEGRDPDKVMPAKGPRLTSEQIGLLRRWIDQGAEWPDESKAAVERSQHWALQPLRMPTVPAVAGAPTEVDAFVRSKLSERGMSLSPPADRRTLIRRLSFDLIGLPPTPEEIDRFLADRSPQAYETVVERLLASPRYGERWGRHWLDVARYTESQGFEYDRLRENAWHYRDYVINSFNEDKPYDLFMKEQIAGDVLEPVSNDRITAPSLLVCGPWDQAGNSQKNEAQRLTTREDELEDTISVVGQTFLGLTINCARCHSHKFDPIPQEEYYRIKSVFEGVKHGERPLLPSPEEIRAQEAQIPALKKELATANEELARVEARKAAVTNASGELLTQLNVALAAATKASNALQAVKAPRMTYAGTRAQPTPTRFLKRGDVRSPEQEVRPGALSAIMDLNPDFGLDANAPEAQRRLKFAEWLADARNPLPARVMANRIWHWHFGQGLVSTPSDFGVSGARPSHPELLDWLAMKFIQSGWSVKALHRVIVDSATYRQSSGFNPEYAAIDAENQLLWRFTPRRLEAEAVRDTMLSASGELNSTLGGPGFRPFTVTEFNASFYHLVDRAEPEFNRRSVYRANVNSGKDPLLDAFDCPDPSVKTPRRGVTATPLQALELMNNSFVQRQAKCLAQCATKASGKNLKASVRTAYLMTLGREPSRDEINRALPAAKERGLASVCWALLNSTEFIYVQ